MSKEHAQPRGDLNRSADEFKERAFLIREMAHHATAFTHAMEMLENRINRFAEAKGGMIPQSETDAGLYQIASWEQLFHCFDAPCEALAKTGDTAPRDYLESLLERVLHAAVVVTPAPYSMPAIPGESDSLTPAKGTIDQHGNSGKVTAIPSQQAEPGSDPIVRMYGMLEDERKAIHEEVLKRRKVQAESMRRIIDARIASFKRVQEIWKDKR